MLSLASYQRWSASDGQRKRRLVDRNQIQNLHCDTNNNNNNCGCVASGASGEKWSPRGKLTKGCLCRSAVCKQQQQQKQHHESDLTCASPLKLRLKLTTTMETDESSRIMNQSRTRASDRYFSSSSASGGENENSNLCQLAGDNESVNSANDKCWSNSTTASRDTNGLAGATSCGCASRKDAGQLFYRSSISRFTTCAAPMQLTTVLLLLMSACLAQAGFWTFYFPNFLKASGYKELTEMIENVEKQINSTLDAHADALHFWKLMKEEPNGQDYYPEESACEEIFPLFRDKAIEYAEIDFRYFMEPLVSYREHLLTSRDLWFPGAQKSKTILPREYEQDLYKRDLESKIASFDALANRVELRQMREEMVNIWRNVKRSLDTSLPCLYLRYSYRHMAADINQFALEMNLKSLQQSMQMLESAYKRVALYKEQDRAAIERIQEDIEREQNLVIH